VALLVPKFCLKQVLQAKLSYQFVVLRRWCFVRVATSAIYHRGSTVLSRARQPKSCIGLWNKK